MKKLYTICIVLVVIFFVLGIFIGYLGGLFSEYKSRYSFSQRQEAFQNKTEAYSPTCEQLRAVGNPQMIQQRNDYFVVSASEDYFVVFGFNAEPGKVPVTAWWGAGRHEAIRQTCGETK